ncbi:hypothetical protein OCV62_06565 [Gallintestinimicrobium propionicum]|uniref:hypothetical protein n=1 Tax=Gallintestinimicrobium propionicum TaxID=2981770 RepID=UPI0021D23E38|nr:hypothetical protein [Gallintestinimicrobium propionicum]MCU6689647.1 hypothetical protein [Gallintestinimicrobium propionicum]
MLLFNETSVLTPEKPWNILFMTIECSQSVHFIYGIYPVEGIGVFRVPKNGDARNKKPPALRVETKRCTKKSPFRYNRVVQALL